MSDDAIRPTGFDDDGNFFDGVHDYPVSPPKPTNWHSHAGKIGAHTRWANETDRSGATRPAREALLRKFEDQVDPERVLPPDERGRRAESARRAHYQRMAMASAKSRAAKRAGKTGEAGR